MSYWFYILIGLAVIIIIYALLTMNKLISLNNKVKEAFATMDVYLKKRWDLIPNIVETVKGYAKHEKDTLEEIVKLRNITYDDMSTNDKIQKNLDVNSNISKLMMLAENYPELKASENFLSLSEDLRKVEDEIAQARKYYNAVVRLYNNKVQMFPSNIIALLMGYKLKEMFAAKDDERDNVKVDI